MIFRHYEELVEFNLHVVITFADCVFETGPVRNRYLTTSILYEPGLLEEVRRDRYASALNAKHHCEEFLGKRECIG